MTTPIHYSLKHRKETILVTAEEVFAQYSFAGATIRLITKKSGINSSMIGYYFGSKEALYLSIFELRLEKVVEEIDQFETLDLNPAEKLKAYITAYTDRVAANPHFYRLLCNELIIVQHPSVIAQVTATRKRIHDFLLNIIARGIAQGYFKKIDEELVVLNILALVRSVFTDYLITCCHLNKPPQEDFTRRIVDYIMTILTPHNLHPFKRKSHV
jgi:AcrR family transcriptional regulator